VPVVTVDTPVNDMPPPVGPPEHLRYAANDGTYFSIPSQGGQNHYQRSFQVPYSVTSGGVDVTGQSQVTSATVEIDNAADGSILQQAFQSPSVTAAGCGIVNVQVTFSGNVTSAVPGIDPPPAKLICKITLTAMDTATGASGTSQPFDSAPMHALWPMPAQFNGCRFGTRDPGGDDWVSSNTYKWMEANPADLTAINDISGEHGVNLGHNLHGTQLLANRCRGSRRAPARR
jgi:hypothetical protein